MNARCNQIARKALLCAALLLSQFAQAEPSENTESPREHSTRLDALSEKALQAIVTGDWLQVSTNATNLVNEFPDYALGHLLLAEAHTVLGLSEPLLDSLPHYTNELVDLLAEARSRAHQSEATDKEILQNDNLIPAEIIQVGKHIDHVVIVDLASSTLSVLDTTTQQPTLLKQHYVSSGEGGFGKLVEGDLMSPLGIYQAYGFRSDASLPDLYGSGALMLNYPNVLDRSLGRSGSGIWLHGNPRKNRSRSPRSSEGCITMANDHLVDLYNEIDISRTHIILSHHIQWKNWEQAEQERERAQELFEQYRNAWVNNSMPDLISLYSEDALPAQVHYASEAQAKKVRADGVSEPYLSPTGIDLASLETISPDDVSILINPDVGKNIGKHLVMAFELPNQNSAIVTLYWEQTNTGYWQVKREAIEGNGV